MVDTVTSGWGPASTSRGSTPGRRPVHALVRAADPCQIRMVKPDLAREEAYG